MNLVPGGGNGESTKTKLFKVPDGLYKQIPSFDQKASAARRAEDIEYLVALGMPESLANKLRVDESVAKELGAGPDYLCEYYFQKVMQGAQIQDGESLPVFSPYLGDIKVAICLKCGEVFTGFEIVKTAHSVPTE